MTKQRDSAGRSVGTRINNVLLCTRWLLFCPCGGETLPVFCAYAARVTFDTLLNLAVDRTYCTLLYCSRERPQFGSGRFVIGSQYEFHAHTVCVRSYGADLALQQMRLGGGYKFPVKRIADSRRNPQLPLLGAGAASRWVVNAVPVQQKANKKAPISGA
jgi:hypothetical protein